MALVGKLPNLLGEHHPVDEDDRVPVFHDLQLRGIRERTGRDVDADPSALKSRHYSCDLIRGDRGFGFHTFGLAENDELGDGHPRTHVEPSDEIGATVLRWSGQPTLVVLDPVAADNPGGYRRCKVFEVMFTTVEPLIDRLEVGRFGAALHRSLVRQLMHGCASDASTQARQGDRALPNPPPPRLRRLLERQVDRRARVPSFVHPRPVKLIILGRKVQQSKVEHVVDERRATVARPLNDSFGSLDDSKPAELDMSFRTIVTTDRSEDHQRYGSLAELSGRSLMSFPCR